MVINEGVRIISVIIVATGGTIWRKEQLFD